MYSDKITQSIADAVSKVLDEELKGKQHKIDKNKNNKIDAEDFKILRGEEVEQVEEGWDDMIKAAKEREAAKGTGNFEKRKISTGTVYTRKHTPEAEEGEPKPKKKIGKTSDLMSDEEFKKKHGMSRKNYERMKSGVKIGEETEMKSFTQMLESYQEHGLKALSEMIPILEEASEEEYNNEVKEAQAKSEGKGKKAEVAKAAVQSVQQEETEKCPECGKMHEGECEEETVEEAMSHQAKTTMKHIKNPTPGEKKAAKDIKPGVSGYADRIAMLKSAQDRGALKNEEVEQVEERTLTEPEMNKREEYVKGMKKKLSGFKQRYGDRAKEVMYATATKMAKED